MKIFVSFIGSLMKTIFYIFIKIKISWLSGQIFDENFCTLYGKPEGSTV
jgi:hypothetical protein